VAGEEVYGSCPKPRAICEDREQAYVLRVRSNSTVTLAGQSMTGAQVADRYLKSKRRSDSAVGRGRLQ
jgi:hypothetical protein